MRETLLSKRRAAGARETDERREGSLPGEAVGQPPAGITPPPAFGLTLERGPQGIRKRRVVPAGTTHPASASRTSALTAPPSVVTTGQPAAKRIEKARAQGEPGFETGMMRCTRRSTSRSRS
jgi:hypothetical protein